MFHLACPVWLLPFSVTSTIRKRAFPAIILSYASRALGRGMTSIIGSTFSSKENSTVSCSSCTLPVVDPEMECMPKTRDPVLTSVDPVRAQSPIIFLLRRDRSRDRTLPCHLELWRGWHRLRRALFFFSSRRRHTSFDCDWSSDVCSSD